MLEQRKTDLALIGVAGLAILIVWYVAALALNFPQVMVIHARDDVPLPFTSLALEALRPARPVLPTVDQIATEIFNTTFGHSVTSPRSLVHHSAITLGTAVAGTLLGATFGLVLATAIVHNRTLEVSAMPLVIASQTVPILAIAPMAVVLFGNLGLSGFVPKVLITSYLCFFPVTIAMVKGLRSVDRQMSELFETYAATDRERFFLLKLPASLPFLFTGLKISAATGVVGAIVSEMPTGGGVGLGARLLSGSYYGQTVQIWAALVASAAISILLIWIVTKIERRFLVAGLGR